MPAIKDEAIVLRRLDYSETSQVLLFLTRANGPQRLIAKGIKRGTKKKFATGIDLLERGHVVFVPSQRESLGTLTEWQQADLYLGLRDDLRRLYAAQYAAEVTAAMTQEADPHPELFDALADLLTRLSGGEDSLCAVVGYQVALLRSAGLQPEIGRCVRCGKPAPPGRAGYFSAHEGGLVCSGCEPALPEKRKVSSATLSALREQSVAPQNAPGIFDLLNYAISHAIGKQPALTRFILP